MMERKANTSTLHLWQRTKWEHECCKDQLQSQYLLMSMHNAVTWTHGKEQFYIAKCGNVASNCIWLNAEMCLLTCFTPVIYEKISDIRFVRNGYQNKHWEFLHYTFYHRIKAPYFTELWSCYTALTHIVGSYCNYTEDTEKTRTLLPNLTGWEPNCWLSWHASKQQEHRKLNRL